MDEYQIIGGLDSEQVVELRERILSYLDGTDNEDACWIWTGYTNHGGYGRMGVYGVNQRVHRVMYELYNGPIPEGLFVCHSCDRPPCANPKHLFVGTNEDNLNDMREKGREYIPQSGKGEKNPRSLLRRQDIQEIRRRRANGALLKELAKEYGVHFDTISKIANRKSWSHV